MNGYRYNNESESKYKVEDKFIHKHSGMYMELTELAIEKDRFMTDRMWKLRGWDIDEKWIKLN